METKEIHMPKTSAYAATAARKPLAPYTIDRRQPGDIELKMLKRMFQLESTAADELRRSFEHELVIRFNRIAGLPGQLVVDPYLPGQDGSLGLFPAFTKPAINQRLIHSEHT